MKLRHIMSILLIILAIGASGCTNSTPATMNNRVASEPFIGTWQNTESYVRIQVFEDHSVIASADNPCNFSQSTFSKNSECVSYVFSKGDWMSGPNQTYGVTLEGDVILKNKGTTAKYWQTQHYQFTYDNTTDSISSDNGAPWKRR